MTACGAWMRSGVYRETKPILKNNSETLGDDREAEMGFSQGPNPNLQYGTYDLGGGWVDPSEFDYGYVQDPEGQYVFEEPHF